MTETAPLVLRQDVDGIATLTLNAPSRLNALSAAMVKALADEFSAIAADTSVRVVILAAAGKAFCAGHDLKEIDAAPGQSQCEALFGDGASLMLQIAALPQPVIAKVHGIATAAGCQLVAGCDLAIASVDAKFATSGINLGLFCAMPSVPIARTMGRKAAAEMLYTGRFIDAVDAADKGLINRAVGADTLDVEVENLAREIAAKSPAAVASGKAFLRAQLELKLDDAYALATRAMADNMQIEDAQGGVKAFVEKRPLPVWKDRKA